MTTQRSVMWAGAVVCWICFPNWGQVVVEEEIVTDSVDVFATATT